MVTSASNNTQDQNKVSTDVKRDTILLNSAELSQWQHLPELADFIDQVFIKAHASGAGYELLPSTVLRLQNGPQQLVDEIGPEGFCVIMFSESDSDAVTGKKIIGTGSAKPYKILKDGVVHGSDTNMLFKRKPATEKDTSAIHVTEEETDVYNWELIAFATDSKLQGQGIAGQLTDLTVAEIKDRVNAAWKKEHHELSLEQKPQIQLMLSTAQELNEKYYLKRGWTTTASKRFPAGVGGSQFGFGIVEMVKPLVD